MSNTVVAYGNTYPNTIGIKAKDNNGNTLIFLNTDDATAAASDLADGKTAYVNGEKIVGTGAASDGTDTSDATLTSGGQMLSGVTAYSHGTKYTGTITTRSSSSVTASGATVTVPAGFYQSTVERSVESGSAGTPTATKSAVNNHVISVTPSVTNTSGYISGGTKTGTAVTVAASELVSGNKAISSNGTNIDVVNYATVSVSVSGGGSAAPELQTKSVSPTESEQSVTPDSGYDGLSEVTVGAISSTYVGSGIARRSSTDLTASGATVTAPAGYYSAQASKSVASGTAGTPTATKGTVSNHSVSVTPSVANTTGYITGGTKTGTAVTVSASELVSGNKAISANGTGIDVTNYATVSVAVPGDTPSLQAKTNITPSTSSQTITPDNGYDGLSSVQINAMPSGSATTPATTVTVTPSISVNSSGLITASASGSKSVTPTVSAGYVSSGTAGTITVSGSNTSQLSTQAATTITPSSSQQTAVAAGKYTTGAVTVAAIPSSYVQPTATQGATTYNVSNSNQTIASGTYLTGTQTIRAVTYSGLSAGNIASGVTVKIGDSADDDRIASVTGTLAFATIYTGSSAPSSSLGGDGDIYIRT